MRRGGEGGGWHRGCGQNNWRGKDSGEGKRVVGE